MEKDFTKGYDNLPSAQKVCFDTDLLHCITHYQCKLDSQTIARLLGLLKTELGNLFAKRCSARDRTQIYPQTRWWDVTVHH